MASEWKETTIADVCEGVYDGPHATPKKTSSGAVFLGIWNLVDGRVDLSSTEHLSEEDWPRWTRRVVPEAGDLVFSYETKLGSVALIPNGLRCCLGRRMALARPNREVIDPRFLLFYFLARDFQEVIRKHTVHGSTVDRIPLLDFPRFPVRIPPLPEQQRIAHILGTLDDKIELNRRMNATLEAMARALFQSWFVDFDPVRAKAAGQPPAGMDKATAAHFPPEFETSELGEIPKGWNVGIVGDVVEGLFDGPHATPPAAESGAVFLGIKNLAGTRLDLQEIRFIAEADWARWTKRVQPRKDDVVFSYEAALGLFALIPSRLRCCLGRRLALVRPNGRCGPRFLLHWFTGTFFQSLLNARAMLGATVDRTSLLEFPKYPVLLPPEPVVRRFETMATPIWEKIFSNDAQSRTLAALRDALLPKLLRGDVGCAGNTLTL